MSTYRNIYRNIYIIPHAYRNTSTYMNIYRSPSHLHEQLHLHRQKGDKAAASTNYNSTNSSARGTTTTTRSLAI